MGWGGESGLGLSRGGVGWGTELYMSPRPYCYEYIGRERGRHACSGGAGVLELCSNEREGGEPFHVAAAAGTDCSGNVTIYHLRSMVNIRLGNPRRYLYSRTTGLMRSLTRIGYLSRRG